MDAKLDKDLLAEIRAERPELAAKFEGEDPVDLTPEEAEYLVEFFR